MLLADTSVWVQEFRSATPTFQQLLAKAQVLMHPAVIGELACGNLPKRVLTLEMLTQLPQVTVATDDEVMKLIEQERLSGQGLGWIDVHLLASAKLHGCRLQTRDIALQRAGARLHVV